RSAEASRSFVSAAWRSFVSAAWRSLFPLPRARFSFPGRPRGAELDTARKAARIVTQEIADDFRDLLRRNLPVGARGFVSARERGGNRSRHDVADANVVVPHFLHQRLAERVQPGLPRTV